MKDKTISTKQGLMIILLALVLMWGFYELFVPRPMTPPWRLRQMAEQSNDSHVYHQLENYWRECREYPASLSELLIIESDRKVFIGLGYVIYVTPELADCIVFRAKKGKTGLFPDTCQREYLYQINNGEISTHEDMISKTLVALSSGHKVTAESIATDYKNDLRKICYIGLDGIPSDAEFSRIK